MDCEKCEIIWMDQDKGNKIKFCSLHAAARKLLQELKNAVGKVSFEGISRAKAAIVEAEK
ncbi:MAG TPA: hypothetical protein ENI13_01580 [candidate division CPR3 bacterium]|uniref:Uncharacterized protein n=1 Tax=candidate division CPR3 bacterium TaxID=2268181 RepID=A0A7C1P5N6_UNCC3|nr:hypothetical protein [candidate division CPR3 bacterium]